MTSSRFFSIKIITEGLSSSIQVSDEKETVVLNLPVDPMDNTVPAVISAEALARLGNDKDQVLELLSGFMLNHVGAKQFLIVPTGTTLKGFVPAEESKAFERLRHCSREQLVKETGVVLAERADLVARLDDEFKFTTGEASIQGEEGDTHYRENCMFLEGHAQFLQTKMAEYKEEDVAGMMARCKNKNITPIRMEEKTTQHLSGFMRAFRMDNGFAYWSDETMNQNILPIELFSGSDATEQAKNRNIFLLAYLFNRASSNLTDQKELIIIAARDRETHYEALGFEKFPRDAADEYTLLVGPPGQPKPALVKTKTYLLQNVAHLRAPKLPEGARLFSGKAHLWPHVKKGFDEVRPNNNESYRHSYGRKQTA